MDLLFERLVEIRKYRHLTQEDCAKWYGVSAASYGRKEKGEEGGLGPAEIKCFLEQTKFDARWLFCQSDGPIEEADLTRSPVSGSVVELIRKESERLERAKKGGSDDELAHRVSIDLGLRGIVEKIARLDRMTLQVIGQKIDTIIDLVSPSAIGTFSTKAPAPPGFRHVNPADSNNDERIEKMK